MKYDELMKFDQNMHAKAAENAQELHKLLLAAAASGSAQKVSSLLLLGADAKYKNEFGETALIQAAKAGAEECCRILLTQSDPEQRGAGGRAFEYALAAGSKACMLVLAPATRGAMLNLNARLPEGKTLLINAAYRGEADRVQLLLDLGADASILDEDGRNAMMCASLAKHPEIVRALLPFSDVGVEDRHGSCALRLSMRLAAEGNAERSMAVFDLLLPSASASRRSSDGDTLLMEAACIKCDEVASAFIERLLAVPSIVVDERDALGHTSLYLAASNNLTKSTRLLIAAGADPNTRDSDGDLAISCAGWSNALDALELLALAAHREALGEAVHCLAGMGQGKSSAVRILAPRANGRFSSLGSTALMLAALSGDVAMVEALLPISDPKMKDRQGRDAVDIARISGNAAAAEAIGAYQLAMAEREMLGGLECPAPERRKGARRM